MKKFLVLAITLATLTWATPAKAADTITFNPDGVAGGLAPIEILTLDWTVGNSLLVESVEPVPTTLVPPVLGTPGLATVYFQANLGVAYEDSNTLLFTNGDAAPLSSGNYFTAVSGFGVISEQVLAPSGTLSTIFTLDLANPTNFFNVYYHSGTAGASDLTGDCFTCGTLVLSAVAFDSSATGFNGNFTIPVQVGPPFGNLDQSGADNYPGVDTLIGSGSTNILLRTTFRDINFFPTLTVGTTFLTTNSSLVNPYAQTDPSACFDSNGIDNGAAGFVGDCDLLGATSVGPVNGLQSRIVTQTDANSSFVPAAALVPEPTTLSLLGLGLLLGGAHLRRRAKKNS